MRKRKWVGPLLGFLGGSVGKQSTFSAGGTGDPGSLPGSGRSPGEGHGSPLQNPQTQGF